VENRRSVLLKGPGGSIDRPVSADPSDDDLRLEPKELTNGLRHLRRKADRPIGGTLGVFLGGVISEWASWPWIFYLNIPIAAAVLALTPRLMPSVPARRGSIDLSGALLATSRPGVDRVRRGPRPEEGWGSTATLLSIGGGIALLAAFLVVQASRREPLMRLGILRTPNLARPTSLRCCSAAPGSRCGSSCRCTSSRCWAWERSRAERRCCR
jgi:hypothetical protein